MRYRSFTPEILDGTGPTLEGRAEVHRDLGRIHGMMGYNDAIIRRLDADVRSVMDIGCGDGRLLHEIRSRIPGVSVTGVDLRPVQENPWDVPMVTADATRDLLPEVDVAVCVLVLHHMSDPQLVKLIRNVGRSARRFLSIDLVRHPLPFLLFSAFVGPRVSRITAVDGRQSIRRAYTGEELRRLAEMAAPGARVEQWVSPVWASQVLDIRW